MSPVRIYADFNGLVRGPKNPSRTAVVLDTFGSLRDLSNAGVRLVEDLPLIAADWSDEEEDLEGHGTAQYDVTRKWWVVEFDELEVRYVPAGDRSPVEQFRCVTCGQEMPLATPFSVWSPNFRCENCGTPAVAAIAPPGANI